MHKFLFIFSFLAILFVGGTGLYYFIDYKEYGKITWSKEKNIKVQKIAPITDTKLPELLLEPTTTPQLAPELQNEVSTSSTATSTIPYEPEEKLVMPLETEPEAIVEPPPPLPVIEENIIPSVLEEDSTNTEKLTFGDINLNTREALVNIFCLTKGFHATITPISGSGVIIDKRGVILTNAHIAQYFLLENYPTDGFVTCLIRTGSPASAEYKASLLYLSPPWINENSRAIVTENPVGTGEHDFALLLIDEALGDKTLTTTFAFVEPDLSSEAVVIGDDLLIGAYPAGFLGGKTIQRDLYVSTALTTAKEIFTFDLDDGYLDVISLGGSVVAQQGSSGGAVVNKLGKLIGLISTSSDGETTEERDLRAISLAHIDRSLKEHNNTSLEELLEGNLNAKAAAFNDTAASTLLKIIISSFLNT